MKARGVLITVAVLLAASATAALAIYMQRVEGSAKEGPVTVPVLVATRDIPVGTSLDVLIAEGAFARVQVPAELVVRGAVRSTDQLQGRQTTSGIVMGEQVSLGRLEGEQQIAGGVVGIPPGHKALTLLLEPERLVGQDLAEGDIVTLYVSFDVGQESITTELTTEAEVLKVARPNANSSSQPAILVTLALTPDIAEKAVFAREHGSVWLALHAPDESFRPQGPITMSQVVGR